MRYYSETSSTCSCKKEKSFIEALLLLFITCIRFVSNKRIPKNGQHSYKHRYKKTVLSLMIIICCDSLPIYIMFLCFLTYLAAYRIICTAWIACLLCSESQLSRNKCRNFIIVVSDNEAFLIDHNWTLQNRWILLYDIHQLLDRDIIQISMQLLKRLGTRGYNVLRTVFCSLQKIFYFILLQQCRKNILFNVLHLIVF